MMKRYVLLIICLLISFGVISAPPPAPKPRTAFSGPCNFDSGWIAIDRDEDKIIQHKLGGNINDYVVYFQYRTTEGGYSNSFYGGVDFGANSSGGTMNNERHGAYWKNLTHGDISVYRRPDDQYADFVRVKIWIDADDDWDSGWVNISANSSSILTHNLFGNADDYMVYLEFKDNEVYGIHQMFYGGADMGANAADGLNENDRIGAYWYSLDNNSIAIFRRAQDIYVDQVRVRIFLRPTPTYDSGWTAIDRDVQKTFLHYVWIALDDYVIDLQFKSPIYKVNQIGFGGNDFGSSPSSGGAENDRVGAYWTNLNPNSITVYRRYEDAYAPEVRVRIWRVWKPRAPQYDSLWVNLEPDGITALNHNLTAAPGAADETGLIDLQFRSVDDGINQKYYGGVDMGALTSGGTMNNYRVGAYWYNLSKTAITVKRTVNDSCAAQIRMRIWQMPLPDYNSGWISLGQGATATKLEHKLGGNPSDYLIDFQYKSPVYGINHIFYGGGDFGNNPPSGLSEDDRMGAYWRDMDNASVYVYRRPEDIYAPEARLRIWRVCDPDYDSRWFLINQDAAQRVTHNLGGNAQLYLVKMEQFSADNGINQRHYGGADFGVNPAPGYVANDRVGAYWRNLDSSSITVYRRPEDGFAEQLNVRIWRLPPYFSLYNLRNYLVGRISLWDRKYIDCDVNGDSRIDIADIIYYMNTYNLSF